MARRTTIRWWAPSACWYNSRYNSNILFLFSSRQVSSIALAVYIWCAQNKKGKTTATEHTAARTTLAESISFCRLCLSFGFFSFDAFILFDIASTLWLFICSILSSRGGGGLFSLQVSPLIAKHYLWYAILGRNMTLSSLTSPCFEIVSALLCCVGHCYNAPLFGCFVWDTLRASIKFRPLPFCTIAARAEINSSVRWCSPKNVVLLLLHTYTIFIVVCVCTCCRLMALLSKWVDYIWLWV